MEIRPGRPKFLLYANNICASIITRSTYVRRAYGYRVIFARENATINCKQALKNAELASGALVNLHPIEYIVR